VFEFMMEEFLRQVVLAARPLARAGELAVPRYLEAVGELLGADPAPGAGECLDGRAAAYLRLAEPAVWPLAERAAEADPARVPARIRDLARGLIARQALPSFRLAARAEAAIEPALAQTDLVLDRDYAVIDLRTTVYPD